MGEIVSKVTTFRLPGPLLAAVVAICTMTASSAAAQEWQDFHRTDLGFRIDMPGPPTIDVQTLEEAKGPVTATKAEAHHDRIVFTITHTQYTAGALKTGSLDDRFGDARRVIERMFNAKVTRDEALTINGIHARRIAFSIGNLHTLLCVVVIGDRTIRVAATSDQNLDGNAAVDRFMSSFTPLPIQ